ncbi:hypothetical protein JCM11641_004101 [Rhodosporidiobolus odoratus]
MPHVNLPGGVQLYYEQHGAADPSLASLSLSESAAPPASQPPVSSAKPSMLLLAPSFLNSTYLEPYVEAFKDGFDVTTLELRSIGRSRNAGSATYDYWVAAADIASTMEALHLPPSHVFGAGCLAFQAALKLALLFPDQVLSLSLVGAPTLFAPPRALTAFQEITEAWVRPSDEEDWVDVTGGIGEFLLGEKKWDNADDDWDRVIGTVARRYSPYSAQQIFTVTSPNQRDPGLTPELVATIRQPILFIQGDNDLCFGLDEVEEQSRRFTGARELEFHAIAGGPHLLAVTHTPEVIAFMQPFLSRHTPAPLPALTPIDSLTALKYAASLAKDPKIALRNPHHPESFSLLPADEKAAIAKHLAEMVEIERTCEFDLPMCFQRQDWEAPKLKDGEEERRWTWSTREDHFLPSSPVSYSRSSISNGTSRPLSMFSLQDSVSVLVESSEQTSRSALPAGTAGSGSADGLSGQIKAVEGSVSAAAAAH